jgi:signal transduction histidine kinase
MGGSHAVRTAAKRARPVAAGLRLQVIDRGVGIEPADLPEIFTPFFRADRSRTRETGGFGLGLALTRRIVEAHGGTISAQSQPGIGTTFEVFLPAS